MRKYFLLSAVALMAATTANATTDYAEVTAKATIQVAGTISCTDFNFGTIVVKNQNEESVLEVQYNSSYPSGDILSVSNPAGSECSNNLTIGGYQDYTNIDIPTVILKNGDNEMSATFEAANNDGLTGILTIPANVKAGEYTGSITITATY